MDNSDRIGVSTDVYHLPNYLFIYFNFISCSVSFNYINKKGPRKIYRFVR